eukprot:scaffold903_cov262-Pinguiococcus_pyrenoidosus.AAC.4
MGRTARRSGGRPGNSRCRPRRRIARLAAAAPACLADGYAAGLRWKLRADQCCAGVKTTRAPAVPCDSPTLPYTASGAIPPFRPVILEPTLFNTTCSHQLSSTILSAATPISSRVEPTPVGTMKSGADPSG